MLAALVVAFDWNWLKPPLEHHLSAKSHRAVRIGDLHVSFGAGWQPTVRLRQVFVENAPWASKRPLAQIGEAAFTLDATSLLADLTVVTRLRLVDAEVSMEREADGLRNWRLTRPDDRGPGRIRVQRLEAQRTHLAIIDKMSDIEIDAVTSPIDKPAVEGGVALSNAIVLSGRLHTAIFKANVATTDTLTLRDTGELFSWRARLMSGDTTLDIDGRAGDILRQVAIDGHVVLQGQSLAGLQPWARTALPASRPYRLDAHMTKTGPRAEWSSLVGQVGRSRVQGRFAFERANGRTSIGADLQSPFVDAGDVDWSSLRRAASVMASASASFPAPASALASPSSASSITTRSARAPNRGPIDSDRLRGLDADIALRIDRLEGTPIHAVQGLQLQANAKAGVLSLSTFDLGLAGGHVTGQATLDATADTPTSQARFAMRHVQLGGLLPERGDKKRIAGFLDGRADLQARGPSLDAWLADANGSARLNLTAGSIAKLLDGELGLDGARIAGAWLTDAEQVPIRCAVLALDLRAGQATLRELALDTDKTTLVGTGRIDLRARSLDLVLTPQSKSAGLLTLRRSIRVSGPWKKPDLKLVDKLASPGAPATAACKA